MSASVHAGLSQVLVLAVAWARQCASMVRGAAPTSALTLAAGPDMPAPAPTHASRAPLRAAWREALDAVANAPDAPVGALLQERLGLSEPELELLWLLFAVAVDPVSASLLGARPAMGALGVALAGEPLAASQWLAVDAPLRLYGLVHVGRDGSPLARPVDLGPRAIELLRGDCALAATARACATLSPAAPAEHDGLAAFPAPEVTRRALVRAYRDVASHERGPERRRVSLVAADRGSARALLAAYANDLGRPLLVIELERLARLHAEPELALAEHLGEGLVHDALLYADAHGVSALAPEARARLEVALDLVPAHVAVGWSATGEPPLALRGALVRVPVPSPDAPTRQALWRRALVRAAVVAPDDSLLADLAGRHVLGLDAIAQAAGEVAAGLVVAGGRPRAPTFTELDDAARRHARHQIGKFATRSTSVRGRADLILPRESEAGVDEIIRWARHADQVLGAWGFERRLGQRPGLSALFHGPPGTGKTLAASVIGKTLGREVFRVDLSRVTSMWVGETEKNLNDLFDEAATAGTVLLFDEADSLFAKRTAVQTSNDRYANLAVNFLLQKLEGFEGISLLTTNQPDQIDEAFKRRMRFVVAFPMPDARERERLWRGLVPPECPLEGVDFAALAAGYEMGGGHIQNTLLRAAFLAADSGGAISHELIVRAANHEYRALGKIVREPPSGETPRRVRGVTGSLPPELRKEP